MVVLSEVIVGIRLRQEQMSLINQDNIDFLPLVNKRCGFVEGLLLEVGQAGSDGLIGLQHLAMVDIEGRCRD